jgi:anaerobic selenocysteine-containing dehydrogenase
VHALTGRQDDQAVMVSSVDALAAGIVDGQRVRVSSEHGELVGRVVVDDGMRPGVVSISHAFVHAHVGNLTSTRRAQPLNGMITQTGVPVGIEPA